MRFRIKTRRSSYLEKSAKYSWDFFLLISSILQLLLTEAIVVGIEHILIIDAFLSVIQMNDTNAI